MRADDLLGRSNPASRQAVCSLARAELLPEIREGLPMERRTSLQPLGEIAADEYCFVCQCVAARTR